MTSTSRSRAGRATAPLAAAVLPIALTGCSGIGDTLRHEASHEFATKDQLVEQWAKEAPWLPSDATSIVTREATDGDPASLTAVSDTDLDPTQCAEVERASAPTFALEDTPDVYKIDRLFACGAWAVVATDDGWYGWTPNDPDEQAESPSA